MPKIEATPRYICDECGIEIAGMPISYKITCMLSGHAQVGAFECEEEQHYGCCPAHARAALLRCLDEHLEPERLARITAQAAPG